MLKDFYKDFFRKLINHSEDLSQYIDKLYKGNEYSDDDLNQIFGKLRDEGLISCDYADNRAYIVQLTIEGKHYFDDEESTTPSRLMELINSIDSIEKEFHEVGGQKGFFSAMQIHDSQIFQAWIQELKYELQCLSSKTHDIFIDETIKLLSEKFNGFNDKELFREIKARLEVIEKNKNKYNIADTKEGIDDMNIKQPLIFISHSSNNKKAVELLTDLLTTIGLKPQEQVFCSSIPGYDIPIEYEGSIFEFLRNNFLNYDIHAVFIHSHDYYKSPVCLNEMGAAWALKATQTSFLLPGFKFDEMTGVINNRRIAIKLDNDVVEVKDKLNQLRRQLEKEFSIEPIKDILWEKSRDYFIAEINNIDATSK